MTDPAEREVHASARGSAVGLLTVLLSTLALVAAAAVITALLVIAS